MWAVSNLDYGPYLLYSAAAEAQTLPDYYIIMDYMCRWDSKINTDPTTWQYQNLLNTTKLCYLWG